jgi:hypothetical protein
MGKIKDWFLGISKAPISDIPLDPMSYPMSANEPEPQPKKERKAKAKVVEPVQTAQVHNLSKEAATAKGEPWVDIVRVEIDPTNPGAGAFELDWNDKFVACLIRAGYIGKTDQQIVDLWFQDVCRNVVLETYEQHQADPDNRTNPRRKNLGDGRSEIS